MNTTASTRQQLRDAADRACFNYYDADKKVREAQVDATNIGAPEHLAALEDAKAARDEAMKVWKAADLAATGKVR